MDSTNLTASKENLMFRGGGLAALAIGLAYLVIIALYASVGVPPVGGEDRLEYLLGKTTAWWAIVGLSVLTNFLYVPVAFALYFALRNVNRFAMLIACAFIGLFIILENAVNWTSYGALLVLSEQYAAATSESTRMICIAAATHVSAVLESPLAAVWAIGTLSFAFLVIGFVMLQSAFSKVTAYLGVVTGVLGIIAVAGVSMAIILNAVAATAWLFLVGRELYRIEA